MKIKLLTEHHLEFLGLKGCCTGLSESYTCQNATLFEITCCGSYYKDTWQSLISYYLVPVTKVVCFSRLLKFLRSLYGKQCGPRSDCSYRSNQTAPIGQSVLGSRRLLLYLICQ